MKKTFKIICCITTILALTNSAYAIEATPTSSEIIVDGEKLVLEAYNIDGNNYFKLRDLAYILNGTNSQFGVGYDSDTNSIYLTTGQSYVAVGGECKKDTPISSIEIAETTSNLVKDGKTIDMTAYNINGNNYYKLRDVGKEFDFIVDFDANKNLIAVNTKNSVGNKQSSLDEDGFATGVLKPAVKPTPDPRPSGQGK